MCIYTHKALIKLYFSLAKNQWNISYQASKGSLLPQPFNSLSIDIFFLVMPIDLTSESIPLTLLRWLESCQLCVSPPLGCPVSF